MRLTDEEIQFILIYRQLTERNKGRIEGFIENRLKEQQEQKNELRTHLKLIK